MNSKLLTICILLVTLVACKNSTSQNKQSNMSTSKVGNDKNEHGCLGSAGYTWSVLQKECIKPFELNLKFSNTNDSTLGGYLLFSEDKGKAEFFGTVVQPSLILSRNAREVSTYESSDGKYVLTENNNKRWILSEKGNTGNKLLFELDSK